MPRVLPSRSPRPTGDPAMWAIWLYIFIYWKWTCPVYMYIYIWDDDVKIICQKGWHPQFKWRGSNCHLHLLYVYNKSWRPVTCTLSDCCTIMVEQACKTLNLHDGTSEHNWYMYMYTHTYQSISKYVYINIYIYTNIFSRTCIYIYIYTFTSLSTYL